MLILSFPETREIAKKVAKALKAEHSEIISKKFPDSESYIRLKSNPENKTVVIIASLAKDVNNKLIDTILAAQAARENGANKMVLIATYLPYMRQDKHFNQYEVISAKKILHIFREHFDEIFAIDPHLHRIHSLSDVIKNAESITLRPLVAYYIKKRFGTDFTIVGPDEESYQWGKEIAHMLGTKVIILNKIRINSEKVKIKKHKMSKNIIIIDDIISTGYTALETIKMAREHGATKIIYLAIHAILTQNSAKKITKYAELIATNTIPNKFSKIDVSPIIASELKRYF